MSLHPRDQVSNYVIKEPIAKGGMGVVWRAWDVKQSKFVAIKTLSHDLIADTNFGNRIRDEARRHKRLDHPNIVPVLNVFETGGQTCIVMELIEGNSLSDLLETHGRLEPSEAIRISRYILEALDYAHRNAIIHRDLKPSNILIDKHNRPRLIDFGIALAFGEDRHTRTGQTVGTSDYMSPEQITKPRDIDHRSDVYSMGCVLYQMLAGRPPFFREDDTHGDSDFLIQQAHVTKTPVSLKTRVPTVPIELDHVVMQALKKDPNERIPGCQDFVNRLDEVLAPRNPPKRRRATWVYVLVVLAVVTLIFVLYYS